MGTHLSTSNFHYLINKLGIATSNANLRILQMVFVQTKHFFFGLQKYVCLCLYNNTNIPNISESVKCKFLCGTFIHNWLYYFSLNESMDNKLPDVGFCLTCRQNFVLFSKDCNANATMGPTTPIQWPSRYKSEAGRQPYIYHSNIRQTSKMMMDTLR